MCLQLLQNPGRKRDKESQKGAGPAQVKVKKTFWKTAFELNTELRFQCGLCPELKKAYKKTMKQPRLVLCALDLSIWKAEEGRY